MIKLTLAIALAATAVPFAAVPAAAQSRYPSYSQTDCQRPRYSGESRRAYYAWQRNCLRQQQARRESTRNDRFDCDRPRRRGESRSDYRRYQRNCIRQREALRDWRQYRNYDYDRPAPGRDRYYADEYYRDGRYYQERPLRRDERIYRGRDGRYYCRRDDGTTGLIVGGAVGALIGNQIDNGDSSVLGTLIGGVAGALIGQEIDRGSLRCH